MAERILPELDTPPDAWGPEHDEIVEGLTDEEILEQIRKGRIQGVEIDPDDDEDNGLVEN